MAKSRRPAPPADLPAGAKVLATVLPGEITDWHRKLKPGAHVQYLRDDGKVENTKVRTKPWKEADGAWKVGLTCSGHVMGTPLDRIRPFQKKPSGRKKPDRPKAPPRPKWAGPVLPAGTVVCEFTVEGRAVPWSPPKVNRYGQSFPKPKLTAWRHAVHQAARVAMADHEPYGGPVELRLTFHLRPAPSMPDLSNLTKLAEDSLQGAAIVNDTAVCSNRNRRVIDDRDYVTVKVLAD